MEAGGSVENSPKKSVECGSTQNEPTGHTEASPKDNIVPLEGNPYFTSIMGEYNVSSRFSVKIPRKFGQLLPPSSTSILLCYQEKEWVAKCTVYQSGKEIGEGWRQFVNDNNIKIGDGCVFELINHKDLKIKVQILNGELPAIATARLPHGSKIDTPIVID